MSEIAQYILKKNAFLDVFDPKTSVKTKIAL